MREVNIRAMGASVVLTIILIVIMTIYAELSESFKEFLKSLTIHHWVSKGVVSFIFFIALYFIVSSSISKKEDIKKSVELVITFTILGSLAIFGFYLYEFFI